MDKNNQNAVGERFSDVLTWLKKQRKLKRDADLLAKTEYKSVSVITEIKKGRMQIPDEILNILQNDYRISTDYILDGTEPMSLDDVPNQSFTDKLREKKLEDQVFMVPFVDIPAQAGYAHSYYQTDYDSKLTKYPLLPGIDPTGAIWKYFQVQGKSMEKEFKERDLLLCSLVPREDWNDAKQYYSHVIITKDRVLFKDLFRFNEDTWILLSRNKDYPPQTINPRQVSQLWFMRKHIKGRAEKDAFYDMAAIFKELGLDHTNIHKE